MATSATPQLRQRTAFEIIDVSIQVLRRNYATFVMLVALGAVPAWVVLWLSGIMTAIASVNPVTGFPAGVFNFGVFLWFPFTWAWAWVFHGAVVVAVSDAYLTGVADPGRALRVAMSRALPNIAVGFLLGIALAIGAFALIIPAIYLYLRYFAVMPALLLEDKGVVESFHRSRDLSEGFKWRILGTLVLSAILYLIVVWCLQLVFALVKMPPLARALVNAVVQLFFPFMPIVAVVLYYDQRIRKDGFDLEVMARDLAPVAAQG